MLVYRIEAKVKGKDEVKIYYCRVDGPSHLKSVVESLKEEVISFSRMDIPMIVDKKYEGKVSNTYDCVVSYLNPESKDKSDIASSSILIVSDSMSGALEEFSSDTLSDITILEGISVNEEAVNIIA